jgi:hypothetical protein
MARRFSFCSAGLFCLALVAIVLSPSDGHCQTTITFVSDGTWETFAMNPDGSQGASLGAPQFPSWAIHGANLSAIPGASWMWFPGVDVSSLSDLRGAYFSKQFNLQGVPIAGQILVAVDDFAEVAVNGVVAGSTGSITDHSAAVGAQSALAAINLTPYLVGGLNTLTVKAQNGPYWFSGFGCNPCNYAPNGNPAGVVFGGTLTFDPITPALRDTWGRVKARYR